MRGERKDERETEREEKESGEKRDNRKWERRKKSGERQMIMINERR